MLFLLLDKIIEKNVILCITFAIKVKWRVYSHYFKSIGWFLSISTIIMNAIFQGFSIGSNAWLSVWSDSNLTTYNDTVDHAKQNMYLGVYGGLGLGQGMFLKIYNYLSFND